MNKVIHRVIGIISLLIGTYIWLVIAYGVISQDLGQLKTLELYWKDILYMVFFIFTGLYLTGSK